mgnify:CR=1 FL=1
MGKKYKEGFTLIELLVVIVIIALLAVVVFVALDPATRFADARNSRRWKDVNNLLTAIHECIVDNAGSYTACGLTDNNSYSLGTGDLDLSTELLPYLKVMPMDPLNGTVAVTGYSIQVDTNNIVTITSDNPENGMTVSLSR